MTFEDLPDKAPVFEAQFDSICDECGNQLQLGQQATFRDGEAVHLECPKPPPPQQRPACPKCWLVHGTHQVECDG